MSRRRAPEDVVPRGELRTVQVARGHDRFPVDIDILARDRADEPAAYAAALRVAADSSILEQAENAGPRRVAIAVYRSLTNARMRGADVDRFPAPRGPGWPEVVADVACWPASEDEPLEPGAVWNIGNAAPAPLEEPAPPF